MLDMDVSLVYLANLANMGLPSSVMEHVLCTHNAAWERSLSNVVLTVGSLMLLRARALQEHAQKTKCPRIIQDIE